MCRVPLSAGALCTMAMQHAREIKARPPEREHRERRNCCEGESGWQADGMRVNGIKRRAVNTPWARYQRDTRFARCTCTFRATVSARNVNIFETCEQQRIKSWVGVSMHQVLTLKGALGTYRGGSLADPVSLSPRLWMPTSASQTL